MNFVADRAMNDLRELHGRMKDGVDQPQLEHLSQPSPRSLRSS
jgi:hypothetical protein